MNTTIPETFSSEDFYVASKKKHTYTKQYTKPIKYENFTIVQAILLDL